MRYAYCDRVQHYTHCPPMIYYVSTDNWHTTGARSVHTHALQPRKIDGHYANC